MKDDELETIERLNGKSPDKNIERNEWRDFSQIKGHKIKKSESLKKKGGRAGKQRQLEDRWNKHRWEILELILRMLKKIGTTWREAHRLKRILEALGKLEESGKILGKDLWVRAHSKENTVGNDFKERLHRLNKIAWMREKPRSTCMD